MNNLIMVDTGDEDSLEDLVLSLTPAKAEHVAKMINYHLGITACILKDDDESGCPLLNEEKD